VCFLSTSGREERAQGWEAEAEGGEGEVRAAAENRQHSTGIPSTANSNSSRIRSTTSSSRGQIGAIHGLPWCRHVAVHAASCSGHFAGSRATSSSGLVEQQRSSLLGLQSSLPLKIALYFVPFFSFWLIIIIIWLCTASVLQSTNKLYLVGCGMCMLKQCNFNSMLLGSLQKKEKKKKELESE